MEFPINDAGERLLKRSEGLVLHAYPDPRSPLGLALQRAGLWRAYLKQPIQRDKMPAALRGLDGAPWTMGYGDTLDVSEGDKITRPEAEARLAMRMERDYLRPMRAAFKLTPTPNQLAAMLCLAWNIGINAFLKSTVLRCHNRGDFMAAARAFSLFNKSRGKEDPVLVARRAEEAALYMLPDEDMETPAMPQAVDAESSLSRSPIVTGSTITAGTATVGVAAEAARGVKDIRESLGDWLPWILVAVAIGAAGWAIWNRLKQRRGGWA
ncbi:MAG: lysozyme [Ramlibacter sp.]|nr:lysozyme [Ramlibacter sp.]